MDHSVHNKIVSFIWTIADDCLRDVFVRGKYRDVILPMTVLRRIDCLLEQSHEAVQEELAFQKSAGFHEWDTIALQKASGYVFYNTSEFTLQKIKDLASNNRQELESNFNDYIDGFSPNVLEITKKFELKRQVKKMVEADIFIDVLEKLLSPDINLSPLPVTRLDKQTLPALTNLGMGYVFEELIRRFNEENNEEAGEHFTPREVIQLMTRLLFEPVKDSLPQVIAIYDGACGSGGMLTESENLLLDKDKGFGLIPERIHLFGKEINPETYAICQSDMMIKGKDPQHIQFGSTLSVDSFQARQFDFMLSNPPYGKSWQSEKKHLFDGSELLDDRFKVKLTDYHGDTQEVDATPRSSDGQLLFLMDMVSKMKPLFVSPQGSRIASVHNGSSLFTGNAGGGESNTRRTIIENDLLEAIIQLPNNLFYNTGITTYIWLLSNNKAPHRKGKVQLLDASQMFQKLRKNLGAKNCALTPEHIQQLLEVYREMPDNEISKVFDNRDFGHVRIQVERPLRLSAQLTDEAIASLRFRNDLREPMMWVWKHYGEAVYTGLKEHQGQILDHADKEGWKLNDKKKDNLLSVKAWSEQRSVMEQAQALREELGGEVIEDYNLFVKEAEAYFKKEKLKLSAGIKKQLYAAASYTNEDAPPVLKKVHKLKGEKLQEILRSLLPAFRTSDAEASSVPADHAEQQFSLFPSSEPAPVSEMEGTALLAFAEKHLADFGYWPGEKAGEFVEYVTDSDLKDVETIPLKQPVHHYFQTEVRPYVKDAWLNLDKAQIGYEISFNKVFYRHEPLRSLEEVSAEILQLEQETEGLLKQLLQWGQA